MLKPTAPITFCLLLALCLWIPATAQVKGGSNPGIISGNVVDDKFKPVEGATAELFSLPDTNSFHKTVLTNKTGDFVFLSLPFGVYRVRISSIGFSPITLDSISVRSERAEFNLSDLSMKTEAGEQLNEVVVYAEKPLIQSKEGNITFNAAESPLSAGSNASDLLKNVPLIAADPDGKITVKGKEPRILIDEKPVEMTSQQLQDFLESLPGNMIEKIEVMTNPPPQYANEEGGVINIVTRKGRIGISGRFNVSAGTRGEAGVSGNFNFRKKGLAINFNAGSWWNKFNGEGYSRRDNIYPDSTNYLFTDRNNTNKNARPNARLSIDYDFDSRNSINFVAEFNQNNFDNRSEVIYNNFDQFKTNYRRSNRLNLSEGESVNPNFNLTYTHRGKKPGETLRIFAGGNYSYNRNDRFFFQQFLDPATSASLSDSTQLQLNDSWNGGFNIRVNYEKMLDNKTTSFSTGGWYNYTQSSVLLKSQNLLKPDNIYVPNELLSNDFKFAQKVSNLRFSVRQIIVEGFTASLGISAEMTDFGFKLYHSNKEVDNNYINWLPFARLNRSWKNDFNMNLTYRKTIRRPGIDQLNPSIDYADPYNPRFGNPYLEASTSHNFDFSAGKTTDKFFVNLNVGHNIVKDVFIQVRTLVEDGKTQTTFENIDDRKEYELSSWAGYTFSRKLRLNMSASYTHNEYTLRDRIRNRYRNGGSFTSNMNTNFAPIDTWNFNAGLNFNRFANPQGSVRSTVGMNLAIQKKFFSKRFIVTFNAIDPIIQQENRSYTSGPNFNVESFNTTNSRNFRLTLGYNFSNAPKFKIPGS